MAGGILNTASGVQTIDALLGNLRWSSLGLTYNFPELATYYNQSTYFSAGSGGAPTFNFSTFAPVTASLEIAISKAIASELMAVSKLTYTEVSDTSAADSSFARASLFNDPDAGTPRGGVGYYPGIVQRGGDAWFNADQARFNNVQVGNSAYWVVLHELGHTVGLKHAHQTTGGPSTVTLPDDVNSMEFTVMTYRRYAGGPDIPVNSDVQAQSWAQSLMMYDIAAIQHMYGAEFTTNNSNTVYTFSATSGEMFVNGVGQGAPAGNRIFRTIWDGGGTDTYDLSNYASDLVVDLAPGGYSNFNSGQLALLSISNNIFARGNVFNALQYNGDARSLIENAAGGSGDDHISGNAARNVLTGNAGDDFLSGQAGNDRLVGGAGADTLDGGSGFDLSDYTGETSGAVASLAVPSLNAGSAKGDTFIGIEGLIGTRFADRLTGNSAANELQGAAGNDTLNGMGGNDLLIGGSGNDQLYGGLGNDVFEFRAPGFGRDTIHDWQDSGKTQDVISFGSRSHLTFSDLTIAYRGGNAYVTIASSFDKAPDVIEILHAAPGSLGAQDFVF